MADERRLRPAKLTAKAERSPFSPRFPWKWVLLGAGAVALFAGMLWLRHVQEVDALRDQMLEVHRKVVEPAGERIAKFRHRIEGWITEAAGKKPESWADSRLRFSNLHDAQGLYLRIPLADAHSPKQIARAALRMNKDSIAACLGLTPISLRGLYERLAFLTPRWKHEVESTDSQMRLRVLDEQLTRHIEHDLPVLMHLLRSDYLLVVLQHGPNRRDAPVDVYMWDLRDDQPLLRTRVQADGILLPVHIAVGNAPRLVMPKLHSGGANDCSIAAQVKALAGSPSGMSIDSAAAAAESAESHREHAPKAASGGR